MNIETVQPITTALPTVCETVIVITQRYRCLGFLDVEGIWRQTYNNEEIKEVVGWYSLD